MKVVAYSVAACLCAAFAHGALRTSDIEISGRELQSYSWQSCVKFDEYSGNIAQCWTDYPKSVMPACTVETKPNTFCSCPDGVCKDDNEPDENYRLGYCAETIAFRDNSPGAESKEPETYCKNFQTLDQWGELGLATNLPETKKVKWWQLCPSGYAAWFSTTCRLKKRYIGQTCYDGWFGYGHCQSGESYEYKVSCHKDEGENAATCKPRATRLTRNKCECAVFGWNLFVACQAKSDSNGVDQCNGHVCVWNTGNGNRYCDYGTGQGIWY